MARTTGNGNSFARGKKFLTQATFVTLAIWALFFGIVTSIGKAEARTNLGDTAVSYDQPVHPYFEAKENIATDNTPTIESYQQEQESKQKSVTDAPESTPATPDANSTKQTGITPELLAKRKSQLRKVENLPALKEVKQSQENAKSPTQENAKSPTQENAEIPTKVPTKTALKKRLDIDGLHPMPKMVPASGLAVTPKMLKEGKAKLKKTYLLHQYLNMSEDELADKMKKTNKWDDDQNKNSDETQKDVFAAAHESVKNGDARQTLADMLKQKERVLKHVTKLQRTNESWKKQPMIQRHNSVPGIQLPEEANLSHSRRRQKRRHSV